MQSITPLGKKVQLAILQRAMLATAMNNGISKIGHSLPQDYIRCDTKKLGALHNTIYASRHY